MMRTIHGYVLRGFLLTFAVTLVVLTFVMFVGLILKSNLIYLLARNVSWSEISSIFLWGIPATGGYTIPMAVLTACLLLFGRLSADGEITAMKACGVSLWQIALMPMLASLVLTAVCFVINQEIMPRSHYMQRTLMGRISADSILNLIEAGRFIDDFEGVTVYIEKKKRGKLTNIRITDKRDPRLQREITAKSGNISAVGGGTAVLFELTGVKIDPFSRDSPLPGYVERMPVKIETGARRKTYPKRAEDFTFPELVSRIRNIRVAFPKAKVEDLPGEKMKLAVELNKRLAFSLAGLAFVLLGIPLGIKAHRRESSVGVAMSLLLVANFYLFIILAEALSRYPSVRPDFIAWLPVLISVTLGTKLMEKVN